MAAQTSGQSKAPLLILIIIIIVALSFIIKQAMPKKYYYTADLKCESCGAVFQQKIASGTTFPIKCPKCGKKTAYRAVKCLDCGTIFTIHPPKPGEMPSPEMEMPKCPKCGSTNIGPVFEAKK